jgi:Ca2+-binding EF-hand superfamily protein
VDEAEFATGLSAMLRGSSAELIDFCYFVYDMNGDRSLAREELYHCLKGCIIPGYGVPQDEIEEAEKDIVETAMKKLDVNRDGQITYDDFQQAVSVLYAD